jgi:protoheme IX farnesyltransferase
MTIKDQSVVSPAPGAWARARDYFELTKPKVVSLIMFTAVVGMFLAVPGFPPAEALVWGSIGIALAASSAAAINHVLDRRIDAEMARTRQRPLPRGTVSEAYALSFAFVLGAGSMLLLALAVNALTAILTFVSLIGYAIVYTVWLKRATPQNIVIGGAAGAAPPVLGWTAVTGAVESDALLLFLIIFAWTPPHFWALAIARRDEYARAGIPMLPVTHGVGYTKLFIWYYTILLTVVTVMPWLTGMSGLFYLAAALVLDGVFLRHAWALRNSDSPELPMRTFRYSVNYLALLFAALLIDHYLPRALP